VATRPGYELAADQLEDVLAEEFRQRECHAAAALAEAPAGRILTFRITALDISATVLRALCKADEGGRSGSGGRYLLPDSVLDYISTHHIYS
jgi:nicotinate-nucleotide adenylyltransferase